MTVYHVYEGGFIVAFHTLSSTAVVTVGMRRARVVRRRIRGILEMKIQGILVVVLMLCAPGAATRLAIVIVGHKLRQGDVGRAPDWAGARRREHPEVAAPRSSVLGVGVAVPASHIV